MADGNRKKEYLTTSQVAGLLSVSPDTVLKWVKAGKIKSYRTLGGHFRIPLEALDIPSDKEYPKARLETQDFIYCWEYLSEGGEIKPECRDCITFRSRSRRCYELRDLPGDLGCLAMQCAESCPQCGYYNLVHNQTTSVLVLSKNDHLINERKSSLPQDDLDIRIVHDEYEAASIIQSFRPDYVVIDTAFGKRRSADLCSNLFNDARIPVTRIILASRTQKLKEYCDKEIFGWIRKPFSIKQLRACIQGVPRLKDVT
jgi:excisionase family DNA binding protein